MNIVKSHLKHINILLSSQKKKKKIVYYSKHPETHQKHPETVETSQNISKHVLVVFLVPGGVLEQNILGVSAETVRN